LLIDNTPHMNLFNPPFTAMSFETFYRSHNDVNYLLQTILPYLEFLHSSKMCVYKFVELNNFHRFIDVFLMTLGIKCDDFFCNKVKSKSLNKKRWTILFTYYGIIMYGWFTNKLRWVHALSLLVVFLPNVLKSNVKVVPHDFFPHNHPLMLIW
jgi:hypothetical protein